MKNQLTGFVGLLIVAILLMYMFTFTVSYNEVAILVATFDKAEEKDVITEPGFNWRLPWPIHDVTTYSTRVRLLEDQLEERQCIAHLLAVEK